MSAILQQLGLDQTYFIQLGIFAVLMLVLGQVYFKPFMRLFQTRHKKTVEDREEAERMMTDADARFEDYKKRIAQERQSARAEYEKLLDEAKKEESRILSEARNEAKRITQEAAESAAKQREEIKRSLDVDVESIALNISNTLLKH